MNYIFVQVFANVMNIINLRITFVSQKSKNGKVLSFSNLNYFKTYVSKETYIRTLFGELSKVK